MFLLNFATDAARERFFRVYQVFFVIVAILIHVALLKEQHWVVNVSARNSHLLFSQWIFLRPSMQKGVNYGNQNMLGKIVFYRHFFFFGDFIAYKSEK